MHTFQPFSIDMLDLNPFDRFMKEGAILATGTKKDNNLMTIGWGGIGPIWGKNCAFVYVRESRFTKGIMDKNLFFTVSFLKKGYQDAIDFCGANSGRNGDKWAPSGLTAAYRHGIPYPDEAELVMICNTLFKTELGKDSFVDTSLLNKWYKDSDMHTMYVGEIIEVMAR